MNDISYLTSSYDPKIERIKKIGAPLNFFFITDQHNRIDTLGDPVNAVRSMTYILERCPEISFLVSGGDHGNDYHPDPNVLRSSQIEIMNEMYSLGIPVYACVGNHDDGIGNDIDHGRDTRTCILPREMHSICMKYNPTEENYYYIDDEKLPYRYVFLNTSDIPYLTDEKGQYPLGWRIEVSNKQAIWLDTVALETDRRVLLFSHVPLYNPAIFGSENPPTAIKPYDDLLNGPRVRYIVGKHKNIIAAFAGHVHYDNLVYDNGFVSITTLCAMTQKWAPSCPDRHTHHYTETAFDVVSVKDDMIYLTRFGAGVDREALILGR